MEKNVLLYLSRETAYRASVTSAPVSLYSGVSSVAAASFLFGFLLENRMDVCH